MAIQSAPLHRLGFIGPFAALSLLAACGESNTYVAPPPPKVTVAKPVQRPVTRYLEATGNTVAVDDADLVARVSGFVESINYTDGEYVRKGQVLFVIEPEPYRLKLARSKAAEASAQASLKRAEADYGRQKDLVGRGVASEARYDESLATRDSSDANLKQAVADKRLAEIDVEYTRVVAPFDGVVSARKVSVGEYVGGSTTATVLASIVQLDPIHVNFTVNERDMLEIRERMRERGITPGDLVKGNLPVELALQNESDYPHKGTLDYVSPAVDSSTGTVTARAKFKNAELVLVPGLFARIRIPFPQPLDALLVPDTALGTDQSGRYLLVVGNENVVEQRKVETGPADGEMRVILKGLKSDDNVVVSGIQRAVPGQKVDPQVRAGVK